RVEAKTNKPTATGNGKEVKSLRVRCSLSVLFDFGEPMGGVAIAFKPPHTPITPLELQGIFRNEFFNRYIAFPIQSG
ncbi:MAG: hypothetical protein AB4290_07825, partial [Spirulina sp.]